ncbi:beta 1-4 rhamnosyltransferase Cps2T [Streptococcus zalophi]|uniref:DUF1972 domain-containing protein n=1 Tax=Streptococcus zalophi TaxID=640031 RepID=A0A934UCW4_9STRE|nr:DUF1972 domain-containing protein [Streptococcus zalophi]MBJ8349053.1 DUF1972 domain-containing protein [Streptococcus zalophi]MCR8967796.1 DUF1972 domain-containing protein [Streptococcus zalophi]
MRHVFILGSRGLPASYGGFETFVEELIKHQVSPDIKYHVACLSDEKQGEHFDYLGADCFTIKPPKIGSARVIAYDMMAINYSLSLIQKQQIKEPIFYLLGNTIGGFIPPFAKKIKAIGGKLFVNPDGLEWKRSKWPKPVQMYLKYSEKMMTKYANLIITDNLGIDNYIETSYPWSKTSFIAYGTDTRLSNLNSNDANVIGFYQKWQITEKQYYLILGRFIPENNYETIIREFMTSQTKRDLVIISNHEGNPYFESLRQKTHFDQDKRIKFVGTVYDKELVSYIRENAFAYIHGHSVGGTNPGLLESLAHTNLSLVLDVSFNRQTAKDVVYYWKNQENDLKELLNEMDKKSDFKELGTAAKNHIKENYTWAKIVKEYEELFLSER